MDGSAENGRDRLTDEVSHRLRELEGRIPPSEIGELWVFPPLDRPEASHEFVLLTRMGDDGTRRLYSARIPPSQEERRELPGPGGYTRERVREMANRRDGAGDAGDGAELPEQRVTEHGAMPAGRLPGLVQRFRRRLGDDRVPVHLEIGGSRQRWIEVVGPESVNGAGSPSPNGTGAGSGEGASDGSPDGAPRERTAEIEGGVRDH